MTKKNMKLSRVKCNLDFLVWVPAETDVKMFCVDKVEEALKPLQWKDYPFWSELSEPNIYVVEDVKSENDLPEGWDLCCSPFGTSESQYFSIQDCLNTLEEQVPQVKKRRVITLDGVKYKLVPLKKKTV
jgi:hypothetical protein